MDPSGQCLILSSISSSMILIMRFGDLHAVQHEEDGVTREISLRGIVSIHETYNKNSYEYGAVNTVTNLSKSHPSQAPPEVLLDIRYLGFSRKGVDACKLHLMKSIPIKTTVTNTEASRDDEKIHNDSNKQPTVDKVIRAKSSDIDVCKPIQGPLKAKPLKREILPKDQAKNCIMDRTLEPIEYRSKETGKKCVKDTVIFDGDGPIIGLNQKLCNQEKKCADDGSLSIGLFDNNGTQVKNACYLVAYFFFVLITWTVGTSMYT